MGRQSYYCTQRVLELSDTEDAKMGSALRAVVPEFREIYLKSVCMTLDPSTFSHGSGRAPVVQPLPGELIILDEYWGGGRCLQYLVLHPCPYTEPWFNSAGNEQIQNKRLKSGRKTCLIREGVGRVEGGKRGRSGEFDMNI